MEKVYFAHPVNIYGQLIETAFQKLIADYLTSGDMSKIENPNQPHHQVGYDNYAKRQKESGLTHKGMSYFYDEVLPKCGGCVGVPFLDGRLGLGVAGEMQWFIKHNLPVWKVILLVNSEEEGTENLNNYFQFGYFSVRRITSNESSDILDNHPKLVVPHEETRLRTWEIYNRVRRPYETAHLVKMPIPEGFYLED